MSAKAPGDGDNSSSKKDKLTLKQQQTLSLDTLLEACKPAKKRGRPSHKRQLAEIRQEGKVNLQTSDSIVASTNLRSLLTREAYESLPDYCRWRLVTLLPKVDQVVESEDGAVEPSRSAFNNEFFARFCTQYTERLSDNKLTPESLEKRKNETNREYAKLDPWKLKNFEPIWGQKLESQTDDIDNDKQYGEYQCMSQHFTTIFLLIYYKIASVRIVPTKLVICLTNQK